MSKSQKRQLLIPSSGSYHVPALCLVSKQVVSSALATEAMFYGKTSEGTKTHMRKIIQVTIPLIRNLVISSLDTKKIEYFSMLSLEDGKKKYV